MLLTKFSFSLIWNERLKDIIRHMDPLMTPRAQYRMPLGLRWETRKGVILIGDAFHVMSWFAGEGANLSMLDAFDLGQTIIENLEDLEAAVRKYETKVTGRADNANRVSDELPELVMRDDSPKTYVEVMGRAMDWFAHGKTPDDI